MSLAILNVGTGDTKLSFDKEKPEERERACRIVMDMLKRGFAILVEVQVGDETLYRRAKAFDPETCEYIVAGDPESETELELHPDVTPPAAPERTGKRGRGRTRRVPADGTKAVSVARSAGGCDRRWS